MHPNPLPNPLTVGLFLGLSFLTGMPAHAGLIGDGTNTVMVNYEFPGGSEFEGNGGSPATITIGPNGLVIAAGAEDLATIQITDTQIIITNIAPADYCDTQGQSPCLDGFNGFEFQFSSGVDITGASVDDGSSSDFLPTVDGLDLLSSTDLFVNIAGDAPAPGDELTIDLTFPQVTVPEPSSVAFFFAGLAALFVARQSRRPTRG